jgi:hypothetical protein
MNPERVTNLQKKMTDVLSNLERYPQNAFQSAFLQEMWKGLDEATKEGSKPLFK